MIVLEWDMYVGPPDIYEHKSLELPRLITPFEALSMAAGLRAESQIINVRVVEKKLVSRELT